MSEENKTVFEVGDIVKAFGVRGIVISVEYSEYYPIYVELDNKRYAGFTKDGKNQIWHLEPSLKLIEKAKKKVKKKFWIYFSKGDIQRGCTNGVRELHKEMPINKYEDYQLVEIELEVEE